MDDATPSPETWRPIPGFEGAYESSDCGRVRSLDRTVLHKTGVKHRVRGRILKPATSADGYQYLMLGVGKHRRVHVLVLQAHTGPAPEGMEACHNDGDPANNVLANLRWDTRSQNLKDKRQHGTDHEVNKTHCPLGHRLASPNLSRARLPKRDCLACRRANRWAYTTGCPRSERDAYANRQYERIMTASIEKPSQDRAH